jgi:hypothetical protein
MEVAIAGSPNNLTFSVIDFSVPTDPKVALANANFGAGCIIDADDTLAAVGSALGGEVALYELTDPVNPALLGSINTGFGGVGAISIDQKSVLAGEINGLRAALIDFTIAQSPSIVSTINTGISSIASISLSGSKAVASGPNDFGFAVIDYSNPSSPTHSIFNFSLGGAPTVDSDGFLVASSWWTSPVRQLFWELRRLGFPGSLRSASKATEWLQHRATNLLSW